MLIRLFTSFIIILAFFGYGFALATQPLHQKIEIALTFQSEGSYFDCDQ